MWTRSKTVNICNCITLVIITFCVDKCCSFEREHFVFWPNGTVPFYVNPTHFDKEQSLAIMSSLSLFAFKTCLQFNPVMAAPRSNRHVMVFENPRGTRECVVDMEGHAREEPHRITLGYDCLRSPNIELIVMKALGFPFEHNRAIRDMYIDVQFENILPGFITLFTKEKILPEELRNLPYDINSVMHFGERDYNKNGHRTIIFKGESTKQKRIGLSETDLRKIETIYGPQCQKRDRQAKVDMCRNYPNLRRKREIGLDPTKSLRVNRDITPPPEGNNTDVTDRVKKINVQHEIKRLVEEIHEIVASALENEREIVCNDTKANASRSDTNCNATRPPDVSEFVKLVANHVQAVLDDALTNLSVLCNNNASVNLVQRAGCAWGSGDRCPKTYRSTLPGPVRYSTQHRPIILQSTKHHGRGVIPQYDRWVRSGNSTNEAIDVNRRKRDVIKALNETDYNNINETVLFKINGTLKNMNVNNTIETPLMTTKVYSENKIVSAPVRRGYYEERRYRPQKISSKAKDRQRPRLPKTVQLSQANEEFYADRIWPDCIVRYVIRRNPKYNMKDVRARLDEVNDVLTKKTCARIEEISEGEGRQYTDYLILDASADYVTGRVGGRQIFGTVELFEGGQHRQHAAMMVMAMLGFYFEVSRHDRDKYVRVHNRHIRADKLHHFEKIRSDATLNLPYDYASATHPAWQFWRKVGRTGISTVATYKDQDPDGSVMRAFGQNEQLLSNIDIVKINSVYGIQCFQNQRRMKILTT